MTTIISIVNTEFYIQILENSLISSIENMFNYKEVIFQDGNASSHRAKRVKAFLQERHINSMEWPANSTEFYPLKHLWWDFFKWFITYKTDSSSVILES